MSRPDDIAAAHNLIREMREALVEAEKLNKIGLLSAPYGMLSRVGELRRAAISKADAYLSSKQEEKAVRFGCHVERDHSVYNKNAPIFDDCDQSCTRPVEKEKCLHWREIKEPA